MDIFLLCVIRIPHNPLTILGTALLCIGLEIPALVANKFNSTQRVLPFFPGLGIGSPDYRQKCGLHVCSFQVFLFSLGQIFCCGCYQGRKLLFGLRWAIKQLVLGFVCVFVCDVGYRIQDLTHAKQVVFWRAISLAPERYFLTADILIEICNAMVLNFRSSEGQQVKIVSR